MSLGRIGNTERMKPALKYANTAGTCSRRGCPRRLRRAKGGYYGKYCNPCSRRLIDNGDFDSKVPVISEQPYAVLYESIREVGRTLIPQQSRELGKQAASLARAQRYCEFEGMGSPLLAKRSDIWLLHHYYHHQLVNKNRNPIDWLLHMTAVTGITQLYREGFASNDQMALFLCKRGLGYRSLPSVRLGVDGQPAAHGRFPLRTARMLAQRIKGDWSMTANMLGQVARVVLDKAEVKKQTNTQNSTAREQEQGRKS